MSKTELTWGGLNTGLADGKGPRVKVATPSGQVREVPLTRANLVAIIKAAASALELLDREEKKR